MIMKKRETIDPSKYVTCSGSRKHKIYSPVYDGRKLSLRESHVIDTQDEINSHAIECDLDYIRTRLLHGDTSGLNSASPIFADFHDLPSNFREVLDVALNSERIFNSLPLDVRQNFDNDYRQFVSLAGTKEWFDSLGAHLPPVKKEGVTLEEGS